MGMVRNARVNQGGPKCAGIVGLGLIGGSFARGYAQAGVRVLAWDPDDDVMTAASMGTVAGELNDETLGECDIIVLACYPEACIEWLEAHAQALAFEIDHLIESLGAYSRALKDRDQRYLENLLAEGDRIKRALDDEASH